MRDAAPYHEQPVTDGAQQARDTGRSVAGHQGRVASLHSRDRKRERRKAIQQPACSGKRVAPINRFNIQRSKTL